MEVARSMWKNFQKALEDRYDNNVAYTRSQMIKGDLAVVLIAFIAAIFSTVNFVMWMKGQYFE